MLHKGDVNGIMTDKELHRLSRKDLLQLLLEQGRENEEIKRQLAETEEILQRLEENYERLRKRLDRKDEQIHKLRDILQSERTKRKIELSEAGSIAEAALRLNVIFEAAQKAADQYLYNIKMLNGGEEQEQDADQEEAYFLDDPDELEIVEIKAVGQETEAADAGDTEWKDAADAEPDETDEWEETDNLAGQIEWTERIEWAQNGQSEECGQSEESGLSGEKERGRESEEESLREESVSADEERIQSSRRKLLRRQLIGRKDQNIKQRI